MGQGEARLKSPPPALRRQVVTRVALFGGPGEGWVIEVEAGADEVAVYRDASGNFHSRPADVDAVAGTRFLGIYAQAGGRGPERPVFVYGVGRRPVAT